jgi:biopolymer transport protein ExbB
MNMDIQTKITSLAGMGATWIMWVLVGLSVGGLAIALERALYLALRRDNLRKLKSDVLALLRMGDTTAARARLAKSKSFEAQVVAAGLEEPADGAASAEERMNGAAQLAKLRMERRLAFLGTLAALSAGWSSYRWHRPPAGTGTQRSCSRLRALWRVRCFARGSFRMRQRARES